MSLDKRDLALGCALLFLDLYNWVDEGLIIPPVVDDEQSPLHPTKCMDRPHIIRHPRTGHFVCWIEVMDS